MLQSLTYPARPTLDPLQLRFLDEIARQWRESGEWPRTEKIRLRLRAELDFDRVVATVRGELSQPIENPDRRQHQTRLTVAGLEYVPGGAGEVTPFVAAVRCAAQEYAAAGHARLVVDRPDLQRWFPEATDSHWRLLELYRLDWSGGYSRLPAGGFSSDLSLDHVRLIDAETGWDLIARLANRGRYAGDAEQGELELLRAVYERWHATGRWPSLREIVLANPAKPAALELLQNLPLREPRQLESTAVSGAPDREFRLTLLAVARIAPGQEADLFARMLGILASRYIKTEGEGTIDTAELASLLGVTADELARACELGRYASSGVGFAGAEGRGIALLNVGIDRWEGVRNYADYERATAKELISLVPQPSLAIDADPDYEQPEEQFVTSEVGGPRRVRRRQFAIPGVAAQRVRVSEVGMERRYEVFISSTFVDLKEEREKVMRAVLKLDCFPAGMELFPAADATQWKVIQRAIDRCDYYVVLVAGRYGSLGEDNLSYTEQEFDYAIKQGVPVLAFVHGDPDSIPAGKTDKSDDARRRLEAFRAKVSSGRMRNEWLNPDDLAAKVALALVNAFKTNPRPGWVRVPSSVESR